MQGIETLIIVALVMFAVLGAISVLAHIYNLNNIKSKTVGDGQQGTARWAREEEIKNTYKHIPFRPEAWRKGDKRPAPEDQGIVVGCKTSKGGTTAMVDTGDVHALMIGAAGVGKTAYFLYPNLEYACASGMSFISSRQSPRNNSTIKTSPPTLRFWPLKFPPAFLNFLRNTSNSSSHR